MSFLSQFRWKCPYLWGSIWITGTRWKRFTSRERWQTYRSKWVQFTVPVVQLELDTSKRLTRWQIIADGVLYSLRDDRLLHYVATTGDGAFSYVPKYMHTDIVGRAIHRSSDRSSNERGGNAAVHKNYLSSLHVQKNAHDRFSVSSNIPYYLIPSILSSVEWSVHRARDVGPNYPVLRLLR